MEKARGEEREPPVNGWSRAPAQRAATIAFALTERAASRRIAAMRAAGMALPSCRYLALAVALALGAVPAIRATAAEGSESEQGEAAAGEPAAPTIYKWIDEHGIAHYTTDFERIPEELRKRSKPLGPPNAALTRTPVEADAPARSVPPPTGLDGGERWAVQDRSFDRPHDSWDEGDPYADTPGSEPGGDGDLAGDSEQREQQIEDLDQRIASLRTDIAANEEALKAMISLPVAEGGGSLAMADNPNFRAIADRLPELLEDLRTLEDERAQLEAP
jgi:hypothetical protein